MRPAAVAVVSDIAATTSQTISTAIIGGGIEAIVHVQFRKVRSEILWGTEISEVSKIILRVKLSGSKPVEQVEIHRPRGRPRASC